MNLKIPLFFLQAHDYQLVGLNAITSNLFFFRCLNMLVAILYSFAISKVRNISYNEVSPSMILLESCPNHKLIHGSFHFISYSQLMFLGLLVFTLSVFFVFMYVLPIESTTRLKYFPGINDPLRLFFSSTNVMVFHIWLGSISLQLMKCVEMLADVLLLVLTLIASILAHVTLHQNIPLSFDQDTRGYRTLIPSLYMNLIGFYKTFHNTDTVCIASSDNTIPYLHTAIGLAYFSLPSLLLTMQISIHSCYLVMRKTNQAETNSSEEDISSSTDNGMDPHHPNHNNQWRGNNQEHVDGSGVGQGSSASRFDFAIDNTIISYSKLRETLEEEDGEDEENLHFNDERMSSRRNNE